MAPEPSSLKPEKRVTVYRSSPKHKTKTKSSRIKKPLIEFIVKKIKTKELTIEEASEKYNISCKILNERVRCVVCNMNHFTDPCPVLVFTTEQQNSLRDHIIKCSKTQYGLTNTTIRKMAYEYAKKLPHCDYPKRWDEMKMAGIDWYLNFRSRHPLLKKSLAKAFQHTCICIKGCHMGPEGKEAFEQLQAKLVISRVFHYLQKEYEYMKMCNDLGLLVNILRRTAEATGVCEQTIASILEDEKREAEELHRNIPEHKEKKKKKQKNNTPVTMDHDYIVNGEENTSEKNRINEHVKPVAEDMNIDVTDTEPTIVNTFPPVSGRSRSLSETLAESPMLSVEVETTVAPEIDTSKKLNANGITNGVADEGSSPTFSINIEYTDFERLQQNASLIKSVEVEIIEDDFDEPEDFNRTLVIDENQCHTTTRPEDSEDRALVIDTNKCQTNGHEDHDDVSLVIDDTDECPSPRRNDQEEVDYKVNEFPIDIEHPKIYKPIENRNEKNDIETSNRVPTQLNKLIESENERLNTLYISNITSAKPNRPHYADKNQMDSIDVAPKNFRDLYELVKSDLRDRQRSISQLLALHPGGVSPKENLSLLRKISLFIDGARAKKKKAGYESRFISRYGEWLDTEIDWFNDESRDSRKVPT